MEPPIVFPINSLNREGQELTSTDKSSLTSISIQNSFDTTTDFIEAYLYNITGNLITQITTDYTVTAGIVSGSTISELKLNPKSDIERNSYLEGSYNINYNFLSPFFTGNPVFRIQEVSITRTEIRVNNASYSLKELQEATEIINSFLNNTPTFQGYYLNFGLDNILLAVNITLDGPSILVKLYEPLPDNYDVGSNFTFVKKKAEPAAFSISFFPREVPDPPKLYIKGPNFATNFLETTNNSTEYKTLETLFNSNTNLTNQLKSVLTERRAELNTDFTVFANFAFFSSIQQRLINFYNKASLIEYYTNQIALLNNLTVTTETSASKNIFQEKINNLIINFDGYDYFLYFDSGSKSWPKTNSIKPYTLYGTGSAQSLAWYNEHLDSGSLFDEENQNYIYNIYPRYIIEDDDNDKFRLLNEMVAQMFDQVWLYTKAIEGRQSGDNRLSQGISIDLAAEALKSYGISLYESTFSNADPYTTFIGVSPGGTALPPTGSELITNYVTASANTIPFNEAQKLIYKRLYHNLPYILKKKGTLSGLRVLLNCFGIPDTLVRINEFGGKDRNINTWDSWQNQFNYAYNATGSNQITSSFLLNSDWNASNNRPSSVAFRFNPEASFPTLASQSLWKLDSGQVKIVLEYTGSGIATGSYSGSITDPYSEYGTLKLVINSNTSASVFLPFFNGNWWSVLITSGSATGYDLYVKSNTNSNTIDNTIGFEGSASLNTTTNWSSSITSSFGNIFSGSLQEIRYYKSVVDQTAFNNYVMNPHSTKGNSVNSGPEELVFRASLGGELYTGSTSIHPKNSGIWTTTSSFTNTSNFYYNNPPTFNPNYEYIYFDQTVSGIKNQVNNKILNTATILPPTASTLYASNKVLSTHIPVQQKISESEKYTNDVNYVEIALSPTVEINQDINSTLGYFNIGEYIGDPRQNSSSTYNYSELVSLSENYFEKYSKTYNWTDFFRLLKYFDNAVFRMLKDFIPIRAGVATGAIIKQHLLERNKQRPAQISYSQPEYTGSITSLARDYQTGSIEVFTGGAGGSVNVLTNISQSWTSSILTKAGLVTEVESSQYEFYNGEYSGSSIDVVNNKLQDNPLLGDAYRVGIPDLQNLDVKSAALIISASIQNPISLTYFSTGSYPFNNLQKTIPYYNTSSFEYKPNFSIQSDININITGSISGSGPIYINFLTTNLLKDGVELLTDILSLGSPSNFTHNISYPNLYLISGSTYKINYTLSALTTDTSASINSNSSWTVTVDNLAAQSTYYLDPTVYTQQNFPGDINDFSDYNSLLNNVYSNRVSNNYYDVDYNTNLLNPVNFTSIISQSALYAQVQDSNYQSGSVWSKGRYEGVKNTGTYNYTKSFANPSIASGFPIDDFAEYFAYFDYIGGSDPQYPGGGNVHIISLIKTDGTIIGLDSNNNYLEIIEQIFKAGTAPSIYLKSYSQISPTEVTTIVDGGATYQTIFEKSGSGNLSSANLSVTLNNASPLVGGEIFFSSSAATSSVLDAKGDFFDILQSTTFLRSPNIGEPVISYITSGGVRMYNKTVGGMNTEGLISDTLLPLQNFDFIRFGNSNASTFVEHLDSTFNNGNLYYMRNITNSTSSPTINFSGSFDPVPQASSINKTLSNQTFRIFRRIPNEQFVLVKKKPADPGEGLLIPHNFNPNYDPLLLAKKAGLI